MLSLNEFQQEFVDGLDNKSETILQYVVSTKLLTSHKHLDIYRNSVIGILQKTLKEIYPVCCKLVGTDFFIAMINFFIEKNPSCQANLSEYGFGFSEFISTFTPANSLPYLSDVAKLEWAWHQLENSPDNVNFDFKKFAECDEKTADNIVFSLQNGAQLLRSAYPIHQIWETNQENFSGNDVITLKSNTEYYFIIWRKQLEKRIDVLTYAQWQVLTWCTDRLSLRQICENAERYNLPFQIDILMPYLIQQGWLVNFH